MPKFWTYILYSPSLGMFYKGSSNNLDYRLSHHNNGLSSFTSKGMPWLLVAAYEKPSKAASVKLEMKLKHLSQRRLLEFILKHEDGVVGPDELLLVKQLSGC